MGGGTVDGGVGIGVPLGVKPLTDADRGLCRMLADAPVGAKEVLGVTEAIGESIRDLNWWEVREVAERHVRAARAELLGMALQKSKGTG